MEKIEGKSCCLLNRPAITALRLVFHSDHFWCEVSKKDCPGALIWKQKKCPYLLSPALFRTPSWGCLSLHQIVWPRLVNRYHPTLTLTRTRTRTLWSDQCLDVVACEGSRLIRPTWTLWLEIYSTLIGRWLGRLGMLWGAAVQPRSNNLGVRLKSPHMGVRIFFVVRVAPVPQNTFPRTSYTTSLFQ